MRVDFESWVLKCVNQVTKKVQNYKINNDCLFSTNYFQYFVLHLKSFNQHPAQLMARHLIFLFIFCVLIFHVNAQKTIAYPTAPKDSIYDSYFDTTIYDPYQWMENPNDPRLGLWIDAQKKLNTRQSRKQIYKQTLLAQIASMYNDVEKKMLHDYKKQWGIPINKYEFKTDFSTDKRTRDLLYRKIGTNHYKKLIRAKSIQANKNDHAFITDWDVSGSLNIAAINISRNGSDWRDVYFYDLINGNQLPDTLSNLRNTSNIVWDGNGFYYDRYEAPTKGRELLDKVMGQTLYYHKMGTLQAEDVKLFQNPDTTGANGFYFFKSNKRLFFHHYLYVRNEIYQAIGTATLNEGRSFYISDFIVYPNEESINLDIELILGDTVLLKSNWNTPNGSVLMANVKKKNELLEIVPEYDVTLRNVNRLGKGKIACIYRNKGRYSVLIYSIAGKMLKKLDFPEGKKVNSFYENNPNAQYTDFCISSFYHPNYWYQLSLTDFTFKPTQKVSVPYDIKDLETRYVKYKSKDGTEIPMYITCLKSTELNGKNPTLLHGYGGYGIVIEPSFDESTTLWLLHGGMLAVPNIRGGGAEGSNWGLAGRRLNKQNTIDDFIAAAEFLIDTNYTNPEKLAIIGGSHGGLLVGAALTQRPGLFKAAIAEAGVFDMLRFENYTIASTSTNLNEFGDISNIDDFNNLLSYSPLHHIRKGTAYPDVLLLTGDNDDRVPPFHSYKFLASLQELGNPNSLYQMYIIPGAGHGGALTNSSIRNKILFEYYFLFDELGLKFWH